MKLYSTINILGATDKELMGISKKGLLSLNLSEMKTIKKYFLSKGRNPTDCELETIAQTWSEHCKHKTLTAKAELIYWEKGKGKREKKIIKKYNNVLKETIFFATKKINHPDCLSVFEDNAGIVCFDKKTALAFKVETHNHPSALEPYGGAATGIGGVIRDILGCGLGAKPIANTDVFCFGPLDYKDQIPQGVHHPKRICKGVVQGVRDYGNRMGIPTVNGTVVFDNGYTFNPLVYCGCVGIIPKNKIKKSVSPGEVVILVGGKTGRDGIHGATFSSAALHNELPTSVVQIGDAVTEKMFTDILIKARDLGLYTAITDCGAGGLSSACGELAKSCGCKIYLEKVPLKYQGLSPWEIWLSESQERMVVVTEKDKAEKFVSLCKSEDVEATIIGEITDSGKLEVFYGTEKNLSPKDKICELDMDFLHNGLPKQEFKVTYKSKIKNQKSKIIDYKLQITDYKLRTMDFGQLIQKVISHPNVCSKEWIIRQYDHEVQANTVLKPLLGEQNNDMFSPQDAAIIRPFTDNPRGIAISCGIKPSLGNIDIVKMTETVIDEAVRNLISVGTDFNKIFLLDNFCWGDISTKDNIGSLFLSCETAKRISIAYGTPFISGKDSLHNYYLRRGTREIRRTRGTKATRELKVQKISIPPTLLISAIGIIKDIQNSISSEFKFAGNEVYIIGNFKSCLGGSILSEIIEKKGFELPILDTKKSSILYHNFGILSKYIKASHDISDGGLITTIIEMCFGRNVGITLSLSAGVDIVSFLFSEPNSCFVVEVDIKNTKLFEKLLKTKKIQFQKIGKTTKEPIIEIKQGEKPIFKSEIQTLYNLWSKSLKIVSV